MEQTEKQFRIVIIMLLVTVVVNKTRRDGKTLTALEIGNSSREEKNGRKRNWKKKKVDKFELIFTMNGLSRMLRTIVKEQTVMKKKI